MTDRRRVKRFVKVWVALACLLIVVGYGAFRAKDFARGPTITLETPHDGDVFSDPYVELKGTAKNLSYLTLDGGKIFTDESGAWDERILLSTGYNIVTLEAQDRFGRTAIQTLQLIYKPHGTEEKR